MTLSAALKRAAFRSTCKWNRCINRGLSVDSQKNSNPVILTTAIGSTVHLLGTHHAADASADATRKLIEREHTNGKLGCLFLGANEERRRRIENGHVAKFNLDNLWRPGSTFGTAIVALIWRRNNRQLQKQGFVIGGELRAALETVRRVAPDTPVVLGDQHERTTYSRLATAAATDLFALMKRKQIEGKPLVISDKCEQLQAALSSKNTAQVQEKLAGLLERAVFREILARLRILAPTVATVCIDERDAFLAMRLHEAASAPAMRGRSLVAVVGLGHVDGIVERWNNFSADSPSGIVERSLKEPRN